MIMIDIIYQCSVLPSKIVETILRILSRGWLGSAGSRIGKDRIEVSSLVRVLVGMLVGFGSIRKCGCLDRRGR